MTGTGLSGPPCVERVDRGQSSPDGRPRQAMCTRCGRVTARRDAEGLAWCGGTFEWLDGQL